MRTHAQSKNTGWCTKDHKCGDDINVGEMGGTYSTCEFSEVQENLEGGRSIGRSKQRWENNNNPYPANVENMVSS